MEKFLRLLVDPISGAVMLALAIVTFYGLGTWWVNPPMRPETSNDMAILPWVSAVCIVLGSFFFRRQAPVRLREKRSQILVYGLTLLFLAFCILTIVTASTIPLIQALHGASPADIALARENFLKARTGWAAMLPYANALLTATILPYCMCIALLNRYRFRWLIVALFFLYSMIFVEKAFFLRVLLPLMAVVVVSQSRRIRLGWLFAGAIGLLALNVAISGFAQSTGVSIGDFLVFRIFAVPVSTVTDSLDYWWQTYHGLPLKGATSSVIAALLGLQRITFEQNVFVYEWGKSVTGTGSSNAAYFVEAYINFGIMGVIVISLMLGMLVSYIGHSKDIALRCTVPLVIYSVFVGGFLGFMFGGGMLICLILSSLINQRLSTSSSTSAQEPAARGSTTPRQTSQTPLNQNAPLKILVVSQYFHPESFRINTLCEDLAERGHSVTVLTGQPNYPTGTIAKGYRAWSFRREMLGNVEVLRIPLYPRKQGSAIHLAMNYLSFVVSGILFAPFMLRGRHFDTVFVYAVSPPLQALPAILLKWIKHAKLVTWVQDLWPESLEETGFVRNRRVLAAVTTVIRFIYAHSDSVLVQSEGFIEPVARLCARDKITVFHNSAESVFQQDGLMEPSPIATLGDGFCAIFAGNLGTVQALPTILDAAELLRTYPAIRIFLVGSGTLAETLRKDIAERALHNVIMSGHFPISQMPAILARASVLLVTLNSGSLGRLTVPSKIQAYLAAGRPIIAALNGEGARIIDEAQAGLSCPSEDATHLADQILTLYRMPADQRETLGQNGKAYFAAHFEQGALSDALIAHLRALARR